MLQNCGIDAHRRLYRLLTSLSTCYDVLWSTVRPYPSLSLLSELDHIAPVHCGDQRHTVNGLSPLCWCMAWPPGHEWLIHLYNIPNIVYLSDWLSLQLYGWCPPAPPLQFVNFHLSTTFPQYVCVTYHACKSSIYCCEKTPMPAVKSSSTNYHRYQCSCTTRQDCVNDSHRYDLAVSLGRYGGLRSTVKGEESKEQDEPAKSNLLL